jgi:hypothetical protein
VANNPYVPYCLLQIVHGGECLDEPGSYSLGSPEEAAISANACISAWQSIHGALDWLWTDGKKKQRPQQRAKPRKKKRNQRKK